MMKEKESIRVKINKALSRICEEYGVKPEQLMLQFQSDVTKTLDENSHYTEILAELYLAEFIATNSKVERSSVESVLTFMRNYHSKKSTKDLPEGLSKTTKRILKECGFIKRHSKN